MKYMTIIVPLPKNGEIEDESIKMNDEIIVIEKRGTNPSKNRNLGVKEAKTNLIAFINGHTFLSKNWLGETLKFFKKHPEIDIVGGPQLTPKNQGIFAKASGYALSSKFGAANVSTRYKKINLVLNADETILTSANLICKKNVFKKVKFDESLYPGEDPKFISDAKKEGFKIAYSPKIVVFNKRRENFYALFKQIFNYGKTRAKKESILQTIKMPFFLIPSIFAIYLFILVLLIMINQTNLILLSPLILYLFLDLLFSILGSIKNRDIVTGILLTLIYPTIHISYGLGFITYSIKKINS